ncbi:MAG: 30S ribosomal protein S8 [Salinivirgaceae bacterium]|nr:30S ribosomal protein S8 [Salinivirgaceae bacterium]
MARSKVVEIPSSNMKKSITKILYDNGYILNYKFDDEKDKGIIKIALKYNLQTKQPVIKKLERISRPGLRKYTNVENMPRVLNGLGIAVISTSQGVMSDKEARAKNLGGEVLCYIY